jgi:hypothetical protein
VLTVPQVSVWVTRVSSIVTLFAVTSIVPVTSLPLIVRPGAEAVIEPLGVSEVPAGSPVLVGSG